MILTGTEIAREVAADRIVIEPYSTEFLEPNSYGFHLGAKLLYYGEAVLDCGKAPPTHEIVIPETGYVLEPGRFYLGRTIERIGSPHYAATLLARRSTSTAGLWIQFSAPLGHTGAIIPWTLEIMAVHAIIVYPNMLIGKIAFWEPQGLRQTYDGKYGRSSDVVPSLFSRELCDALLGPAGGHDGVERD
jgi:dCTP deaminase